MKKGILCTVTIAVLFVCLLVSGCSKTSKKNKIVIGMAATYVPFCYVDEKGEKHGYDYEVLRAVDELLDEYEFEFETMAFPNLTTSLKSGNIDVATCQLGINPERAAQFLFSEEKFFDFYTYLVVLSSNNSVSDMDSLNGKVVGAAESSNQYNFGNAYLAQHPDIKFNVRAYSATKSSEEMYISLSTGDWDAVLCTKFDMKRVMTAYPGLSLKVTQKNGAEHIVSSAPTHFMFNNTQADLVKAVDGALRTLKANGKMNEIQQSVLGEVYVDFTKQ